MPQQPELGVPLCRSQHKQENKCGSAEELGFHTFTSGTHPESRS